MEPSIVMEPTEGYKTAKRMLKERYRNPYRIADAWIQRVTQGSRIDSKTRKEFKT